MNLGTAFSAFFDILFDKEKASSWQQINNAGQIESSQEEDEVIAEAKAPSAINEPQTSTNDATYTLALLQRGGRLIDFLQEDISAYEDDQVGAAVRQIHKGCAETLKNYFTIEPVITSSEGTSVDIPAGFDPTEMSLMGENIPETPTRGTLCHKGWKVSAVHLPERGKGHNSSIICAAEIEDIS